MSVPDGLSGVARKIAALVRPSVATVWIADEQTRSLKLGAVNGQSASSLPFDVLSFGQGAVGWVAASRTPLEIDDVSADSRVAHRDWWQRHGLSSFLGLPVVHQDRLLGVLALNGEGPLPLTTAGRDELAAIVNQAATALLGIRLEAETIERRAVAASRAALAARLQFEELLVRLSSTFVHLRSDEVETVFESSLRQLGQFLELDRLTLYRLSRDEQKFVVTHSWSAPGVGPVPRLSVTEDFPWIISQLLREQPVAFSRPDELPLEGARDAETFRRRSVCSNLAIPLVAGGRILGCLAFVTLTSERAWPDDLVQRLRLVGEIFANVLAHKEADDAARESELMKSAILASLSSNVALLDREGRIVTVNEGWTRFARDNDGPADVGVGTSYLDVCRRVTGEDASVAGEVLAGIEAVLNGSRGSFAQEYLCRVPGSDRWFTVSVVPLHVAKGGAVVSHTEITERKRAELEAQQARQELAHFSRVSTIGELAASLAHELNQPLTGALANAQAALRVLKTASPDLVEIQSTLSDIVDDNKRAAEVIRRLRGLLRKGEVQLSVLDLNGLIRDVAKLLSSDAIIRDITVRLELHPNPLFVSADAVHLQQVVLNLLLNAMEAMAACPADRRTLTVRTQNSEADAVHVAVQDAGPGLREGTQQLVFEPFYTTKSSGVGMGLAISKSIIEAHGGHIWVTDNATTGATFHFSLPAAER